jgi:hypothetical protein
MGARRPRARHGPCVLSRSSVDQQHEGQMQIALAEPMGRFPMITFRKKRLTVAIHAQFDMECAEDVTAVKRMIEEAARRLLAEGQAKISYSVADL